MLVKCKKYQYEAVALSGLHFFKRLSSSRRWFFLLLFNRRYCSFCLDVLGLGNPKSGHSMCLSFLFPWLTVRQSRPTSSRSRLERVETNCTGSSIRLKSNGDFLSAMLYLWAELVRRLSRFMRPPYFGRIGGAAVY